MKTIKLLALYIIASSIIISCGEKKEGDKKSEKKETKKTEESDSGSKTPLEGKWVIMRATGDILSLNVGGHFEFKGSNLTLGWAGSKSPGTTIVTQNTFSFQADGEDLKFIYDYKLEGDTMIVSLHNSAERLYTIKK